MIVSAEAHLGQILWFKEFDFDGLLCDIASYYCELKLVLNFFQRENNIHNQFGAKVLKFDRVFIE
jgi:hypothetical protein